MEPVEMIVISFILLFCALFIFVIYDVYNTMPSVIANKKEAARKKLLKKKELERESA